MAEVWVAALATAAIGAGATIYGANKQAQSNKDAAATNAAAQGTVNNSAWQSYLLSRGVNPTGAVAGALPTNPQAVNTKLPLWATANFATGQTGWRKKGSVPTKNTLVINPNGPDNPNMPPVDANALAGGASSGSKNSLGKDILIGNPLGVGGKDRSWYDPLGIF